MKNRCPFALLLSGRFRWVFIALLAAIVVGGYYWGFHTSKVVDPQGVAVADVAPDQMADEILGDKPVLLELYTKSCPFCVKIEPELEKVKAKHGDKVSVVKMNAEIYPEEALKYQIRGVPTLVFIDASGNPEATAAGYRNSSDIEELLKQLGFID